MKRKYTRTLWILALLLFIATALAGCESAYKEGSFENNGKTFAYVCGESTQIQGVTLNTASMQELLTILEECSISPNAESKPVCSAEQAAYCGVSVLDQSFDSWTTENRVVVLFNSTANVWIIHGQKPDRLSNEPTGIVAINPDTGEAIAMGLIA